MQKEFPESSCASWDSETKRRGLAGRRCALNGIVIMRRQQRQPNPAFLQTASKAAGGVPEAILRQARKTGQLNLSNRSLHCVPESVWHINVEPPQDADTSFEAQGDDRWWDQVDLTKLILAANNISELSADLKLLSALAVLDVHGNQLAALPHTIGDLHSLTRLSLSHNKLTSLVPEICSLAHLQQLKLDHNQLQTLPDNVGMLGALEELDVSHNLLESLPSSIGGCKSLKKLYAAHNKLLTVPDCFGCLHELVLNDNRITSVPEFHSAVNLQVLNLHGNYLAAVPVVGSASSLKELHLGNNRLMEVGAASIKPLTALMFLELRDNQISSLPVEIAELTALERIDLTNNNISGLPLEMGHMAQLKSVTLDGNPLRALRRDIVKRGTSEVLKYLRSRMQTEPVPEPVHHSTKFTPTKHSSSRPADSRRDDTSEPGLVVVSGHNREVDISRKKLSNFPPELFLDVQITSLVAGHNRLASLPAEIGSLVHLTVLDLRNNLLSDLPHELGKCAQLRDVVLSYNRLTVLPAVLYTIKTIENVIADNNQIGSIDVEGLRQLPAISCLDLQNNSIVQVPVQLGNITSLKHLQLGGNTFRNPRAAVLASGTDALLQYLRDRIPT